MGKIDPTKSLRDEGVETVVIIYNFFQPVTWVGAPAINPQVKPTIIIMRITIPAPIGLVAMKCKMQLNLISVLLEI